MTREDRDRMDRLERALRVIWTWANFDRAHGYRALALVPEHVAELCKSALEAKEE